MSHGCIEAAMIKVPAFRRVSVLTALFGFAFLLRLFFISQGPFHYDALDLALSAQKTLDSFHLHYEHLPGYPLTVVIGAFFPFYFQALGGLTPILFFV